MEVEGDDSVGQRYSIDKDATPNFLGGVAKCATSQCCGELRLEGTLTLVTLGSSL